MTFLSFISLQMAIAADPQMSNRPVDSIQYRPGKGLEIKSADGDFALLTRLRAQMLYTLTKSDEWSHGFQLRRARLLFKGNVFGKHNKFKFELAVSPRDIGLKSTGTISKSPLLDWFFLFDHHRDLTLQMGQFKVPYSRQRVVSSGNLQTVDRSAINGEFNLDRDLGMNLQSKNLFGLNKLRYWAGVYMGEGHSSYANGDFGMMYLGRVEFLPLGLFSDYSEASFHQETSPKISIGIGYGMVQEAKKNKGIIGSTPSDGGTTDTQNITADLSFRYSALSVESAFFWREGTRNAGESTPIEEARNGSGFYVQSGVFVSPKTELVARYGQIIPAAEETSLSEQTELGFSVNHYFAKHAMKVQGDVHQLWSNEEMMDGDTVVRIQVQVAY